MMTTTPAPEKTARAKLASDIVMVDGWGYLSGLAPIDLENDRVPLPEGIEAQTTKIFENLDTLLKSAGLGRDAVVSVRVSITEYSRLFERMNSAYAGFFPAGRLPARSCVGVSHLTRGSQVEMDFVLRKQGA
jgi:2-iminobutanoate/2-iminopropanoate deaminase